MSIHIDTHCLECYLRKNLATARQHGTPEQAMVFARELLQTWLAAPEKMGSVHLGTAATELLQKHYGLGADRFRTEKEQSNAFVLERMDWLRSLVESAADPVLAGIQYAITGNYLDFSALQGRVSFSELEQMLREAEHMELDEEVYLSLLHDLEQGRKLLYLTDNAGEIGFDRIFAELLQKRFPHLSITFCVRGGPVVNDATREDARVMEIPFPVIDNGTGVCGTELTMIGQEARRAIEEADVIIAKGMGNTETLYGCGYNIYYLFLVKCQRFVRQFQKPLMTPMLVKER